MRFLIFPFGEFKMQNTTSPATRLKFPLTEVSKNGFHSSAIKKILKKIYSLAKWSHLKSFDTYRKVINHALHLQVID